MGYRSEVALAIDYELYQENREKLKPLLSDTDSFTEVDLPDNNKCVIAYWSWVKWYSEYEDVSLLDRFRKEHIERTFFIRIGEDTTDVEEVGCLYVPDLHMTRVLDRPAGIEIEV